MAASATRRFFVGGNWKSTGTRASIEKLVAGLNGQTTVVSSSGAEVVVAPSDLHLAAVRTALSSAHFGVASQNCGDHAAGAFTGSANVDMIKDLGATHVILGHSERRAVFGESDALIGAKTARVLANGLAVIACVGETLEQRKAGETNKVVLAQVASFAKNIRDEAEWSRVVLAYEPVWAIGTGVVASPQDAQDVHHQIRSWLSANVSPAVAAAVRIIYGGSVKANNSNTLAEQPDIDGFLVGGASLDATEFGSIIGSASNKLKAKF